ncbi:MAG: 1,2-phenylacetyl-CoA epoxidase subunit PaaD [Burkholderiales bacterium]
MDGAKLIVASAPGLDRLPVDSRSTAAIWRALGAVVDPEIPFVRVVELGIVRGVERSGDECVVTITPTYSGCPAMRVIEADVRAAAEAATGVRVRVSTVLAPAWTTDWIAPEARRRLREAGIAPPHAIAGTSSPERTQPIRFHRAPAAVRCPNCGSLQTSELARFGSTACKAQYRCADCLEPFDYFKPH